MKMKLFSTEDESDELQEKKYFHECLLLQKVIILEQKFILNEYESEKLLIDDERLFQLVKDDTVMTESIFGCDTEKNDSKELLLGEKELFLDI